MINQISTSSPTGSSYKSDAGQTSTAKGKTTTAAADNAAFVLDISSSAGAAEKSKGLSAEDIEAVKEQADLSSSSLRDLVQKLILQQQNNSGSFSISIQILGATGEITMSPAEAQEAVGENGDWGVKAVSDRIVAFAKSISGGDPSKLQTLKDAIDKGFAGVKKSLGGALPDISMQTYDAVMSKLDDWANGTEDTAAE